MAQYVFWQFFVIHELVETLFSNKTISCSSLRSGRKNILKEMFDKATNNLFKHGQSVCMYKGPVSTVTWMDNEMIIVVSTLEPPSEKTKPKVIRSNQERPFTSVKIVM